jgi:hypothetical protein
MRTSWDPPDPAGSKPKVADSNPRPLLRRGPQRRLLRNAVAGEGLRRRAVRDGCPGRGIEACCNDCRAAGGRDRAVRCRRLLAVGSPGRGPKPIKFLVWAARAAPRGARFGDRRGGACAAPGRPAAHAREVVGRGLVGAIARAGFDVADHRPAQARPISFQLIEARNRAVPREPADSPVT